MHGRLSSQEKEEIMGQFSENKVQILVSTTVVEVGVNVPNATVMVIYDAERFGLSQLHQLRGRVGRGSEQSYCLLIADPKSETGKERMRIMTETNDGFVLSEKDLELRGPGDFFGSKQSGLPEFKVADMVHDYRALETARQDAALLVDSEAFWHNDQYASLRTYLDGTGVFQGRSSIKGRQQKFLLHSTFNDYILLLVPSHKNGWCGMKKEEVKKKDKNYYNKR